jgi:hypothetical protein
VACLVAINYDPATAVAATTKSTAALLAMTAVDTTNLRGTFTVPATGRVLVRMGVSVGGGTAYPRILLGVLAGATVMGRQVPMTGFTSSNVTPVAANLMRCEAGFVVGGLTPGASLTWDAAYGVEGLVASSGLRYGGPNNAVADDAYGGFQFEVWDA